jgi:hypothetical protein
MTKSNQYPQAPIRDKLSWKKPRTKKPDDDDGDKMPQFSDGVREITAASIPHITGLALKAMLGVTIALYILNQKHLLNRPLSAFVSKTLFWPTLPITVSRRIGKWLTPIDDTVLMGGAPFGFANFPERLYNEYGVRRSKSRVLLLFVSFNRAFQCLNIATNAFVILSS